MQREIRKLVAVVATDIVGYSKLMAEDEEGTLGHYRSHRTEVFDPLINEHRGRIANSAGDSLIMEFSSAVDAVRCAISIQEAVISRNKAIALDKRVCFRVGIHVGDIIADGNDILGDGVNIAARLEGLCEPDGVFISDETYRYVRNRVDCTLDLCGPRDLKNILEPVTVWKWSSNAPMSKELAPQADTTDVMPSIAVLPFQNMSHDPEQEVFADGVAEEIITTLSKVPNLLVVARNSTFTYKGQSVDVKRVGAEQGVRYVLEGSVRKSGNMVRITAQLIDATSAHHLWGNRYDRSLEDIFALQDEIALSVAIELQAELTEGEMARFRGSGTKSVDAWAQQMRAVALSRVITKENFSEARRFALRANKIDPHYSAPLCTLGFINAVEGRHEFGISKIKSIAEARKYARQALELDLQNPEAYAVLGFVDTIEGNHDAAIERYSTALAINPNHADVTGQLALTMAFNDQPHDALQIIRKAMRLNPKYPGWYAGIHGFALRLTGQFEEAIEAFEEYGRLANGFGLIDLAIVYAAQGEIEMAHSTADAILRHQPKFTISKWIDSQLYSQKALLCEDKRALQSAGLPN